jgi:hypothetical protein
MFNPDFYPTPINIIEKMMEDIQLNEAVILEPSAGSGNIVDYALSHGAKVIACEIEPKLRTMLNCNLIADDFLTVQSTQVSHITHIIMNPPFSEDAKHILHAWEIAPDGCEIRALCNWETVANPFSRSRKILKTTVEQYGKIAYLGSCFATAERKTDVEVALIRLCKPAKQESEWTGFFMEEEEEEQMEGLQQYNFVRDVVSRYIGAVQIFDKQLEAAIKMNELTSQFYNSKIALSMTSKDAKVTREEYKKDLQKSAWNYVLKKMNMEKYITKSLRDDINKFVEQQHKVPFTMQNIYAMIQMIIGTQKSRMDKALEEVFDRVTRHYAENRFAVEGWKTNSHYLINQKFILDGLTEVGWHGELSVRYGGYNLEIIEDLLKALCYLTARDFGQTITLAERCRNSHMLERNGKIICDTSVKHRGYPINFADKTKREEYLAMHPECNPVPAVEWGQWFDWEFFEVRAYKKGTMHFKFKDEKVWGKFNQEVARIKRYPLFEPKKGGSKCKA